MKRGRDLFGKETRRVSAVGSRVPKRLAPPRGIYCDARRGL